MDILGELSIILALTLLNGVFAGSELAMLSVRKTRLQELASDGKRSAVVALALRQDTERLLATIQIGITVIGASTAVFGGARLEKPLAEAFTRLGAGSYAEEIAFAVVVALVSYLSLVLGELVPKSLALQRSEGFALLVARGLSWLSVVAKPLVWFLTKSSNAVLWPFRDATTFSEGRLSPEELQQLVEEAAASGSLSSGASELASRAIDLGDLKVQSVMLPRTRMVSLPQRIGRAEALSTVRERPHARYPVYVEGADDVIGYVLAVELLRFLLEHPEASELDLQTLLREVPFFVERTAAIDVLRRLQQEKTQLGIVVDDNGNLSGLVTIEDLVEEIVGEILHEGEAPALIMEREADGSFLARGDTPLHELDRQFGVDIAPRPGATTVAGVVIQAAGCIPAVGARVTIAPGIEAEIIEASPRRVSKVRLRTSKVAPELEP